MLISINVGKMPSAQDSPIDTDGATPMPTETILVIVGVIAAFGVLSVALLYADHATRNR